MFSAPLLHFFFSSSLSIPQKNSEMAALATRETPSEERVVRYTPSPEKPAETTKLNAKLNTKSNKEHDVDEEDAYDVEEQEQEQEDAQKKRRW